jgi:hypothetical protein
MPGLFVGFDFTCAARDRDLALQTIIQPKASKAV